MTTDSSPVESVDRALRLIALLQQRESITVSEAAQHLGVAASTAHRLLGALLYREFAVQDHGRAYRLGQALRSHAAPTFSVQAIRTAARLPMLRLHEKVGETVQLMIQVGGNIQFVDGYESDRSLRVSMRTGDQMPAFTSAGGKAILAKFTNVELEALYASALPEWPTGRITTLAELKKLMSQVRRQGFGLNYEETEQGVIGVGVSINDAADRPIAALTTASPSIRFERSQIGRHVSALQEAARSVESTLHVDTGSTQGARTHS